MSHPIFYSFRRCPYAMRARLALASAEISVELREVVLRDKPKAFLQTSPTGTVPCLQDDQTTIDESLDIMHWALQRNDPQGWLEMPDAGHDLIACCDGPFKTALDRYKYAARHQDVDVEAERHKASLFLSQLDDLLAEDDWLFGDLPRLADMAILPFVRQFAHADLDWFKSQSWASLDKWLERFKASGRFISIMPKYPQWQHGDAPTLFP